MGRYTNVCLYFFLSLKSVPVGRQVISKAPAVAKDRPGRIRYHLVSDIVSPTACEATVGALAPVVKDLKSPWVGCDERPCLGTIQPDEQPW